MAFSVSAENAAVGAIATAATWISLHSADPGTTGASEITGGAYARKQTTWGAVSNSAVTGSAVTSDVPAGTTITHWGLWTALSAGTFHYGGALPAPETFGSNGTYSLTPTLSASD
jgi:hypothetical protein